MSNPIKYNPRTDLLLTEYGRNIQHMVQIAMNLEDRNERNRCARTIIDCMGNMFPYLRDVEGFKHKLWDHLAIMSNFQLDIDYPYEVHQPENMIKKPDRIEVSKSRISFHYYGRVMENFILKLSESEDIKSKDEAVLALAKQMKKSYYTWNKGIVEDSKIFEDLRRLSKGKIDLNPEENKLQERRYNNNNNNRNNTRKRVSNL